MNLINTNLFITLGKYAQRQQENLLTQALAGFLNNSPSSRQAFTNLIVKRGASVSLKAQACDLVAVTQVSEKIRGRRIIVDLELRLRSKPDTSVGPPLVVIESKLNAKLSLKQLKSYAGFLKKRKGKATLILLTKYGIFPDLFRLAPRRTIWISWTELAELFRAQKHLDRVERFLRKEFIAMLMEKNIPIIPAMSKDKWSRLMLINRFASASRNRSLHIDSIESLKIAMDRMIIHRDAAWSALLKNGWKPYARTYIWRKEVNKPYVTIDVGFNLFRRGKKVRERYLELSLDCRPKPKLRIQAGWELQRNHPDYHSDDWIEAIKKWTRLGSFRLFRMPLHKAMDNAQPILRDALARFKKTKYFKGR